MMQNQYQAQQLPQLLEALQNKQVSGVLYLNAQIISEQKPRSRVLIWQEGRIIYGGVKIPDAQNLVKTLQQKLNREWVASAVTFAMRQTTNQTSIRALLERLVEMQLFNWEQIETVVYNQLISTLEQVLPYPGEFRFDSETEFNFCRGLELSKLMLEVAQRQDRWFNLKPLIPSMEAVPHLHEGALNTITEPVIHNHLRDWADGQRSLVNIAESLNKDPLSIAQAYASWVQAGWVKMQESYTPPEDISLPTILAVDDSVVMQELIKRALSRYCRVLVAGNAVDALNLIYHEKVSLLLLDVSMPEIDGLELCRTIRSIAQFRDLPIIMITARDGLLDKVKGRFAGSDEYLIKPFDAEKLRQSVGKYLNVGIHHNSDTKLVEFDLSTST